MARVSLNSALLVGVLNKAFMDSVKEDLPNIKAQHDKEVPLDTGKLQNSLEINVVGEDRVTFVSSCKAENGFDYAVKQHEDSSLHHDGGRKSHYLRDPVLSGIPRINRGIFRRLRV